MNPLGARIIGVGGLLSRKSFRGREQDTLRATSSKVIIPTALAVCALVGIISSRHPVVPMAIVSIGLFALLAYAVSPTTALAAMIVYLPLDWLIVLFLDARGSPAGRVVRDLFIVFVFCAWLFDRERRDLADVLESV